MCYGCWQEVGEPQIDNPHISTACATSTTNAKTITTLFTGEKQ